MSNLAATIGLFFLVATLSAQDAKRDESDETRNLIVFGAKRPLFVRIHLRVDRSGYRKRWDTNVMQLFRELDRDGDSSLNADEAKRLPTSQQFQSRRAFAIGAAQPTRPSADRDKNGAVGEKEFKQYLREAGGGEFAVQTQLDATGQSPDIDAAIFERLDANKDGKLEASEFGWTTSLRKLDTDDDETIGLAELNPMLFSPYASALQQPKPGSERIQDLDAMTSSAAVAKALVDRYGDGSNVPKQLRVETLGDEATFGTYDANANARLDEAELMALLKEPPFTCEVTVWMGQQEKAPRVAYYSTDKDAAADLTKAQAAFAGAFGSLVRSMTGRRVQNTETAPLTVELGSDRIGFAVALPNNQYGSQNNVRIYKQQFAAADQDNNDYLSEAESRRNGILSNSFHQMDSDGDGDGKVFEPEMLKFINSQERLTSSRTFVSVTDQGHNLFGTFDTNRDKRLTQRELVDAAKHIDTWDQDDDGCVTLNEIPRHLKLSFSQGTMNPFGVVFRSPMSLATTSKSPMLAPTWFRKMDRNRDGDLSQREFLGPKSDFTRFDVDQDGLISPTEAKMN